MFENSRKILGYVIKFYDKDEDDTTYLQNIFDILQFEEFPIDYPLTNVKMTLLSKACTLDRYIIHNNIDEYNTLLGMICNFKPDFTQTDILGRNSLHIAAIY